ncbi:MAG: hypothetical protein ACFE9Z_17810, partial [Promethearchaeota archaeon]
DPFTENFDLLRNFFEENYKSSLDFDLSTYFRYGDSDGAITDDTIFSEDNLLYYNSLMRLELDDLETFSIYLNLKDTPLWYEDNVDDYEYGFVKSVDNTTGEIKDFNRYLTDNLLPIFLLIENIGIDDLVGISINENSVIDSIEEMFYLINSSEFWDDENYGFYNYNSSYSVEPKNIKYTESNFYSILANLLIHRTYYYNPELDETIRNRALELANLTMIELEQMWDGDAFFYCADEEWDSTGLNQRDYHLSTNALGIITLLEFWIASGMQNDSTYLVRAKQLYNNLDANLYDTEKRLYNSSATQGWGNIKEIKLESNAMMMSACLKLFEVSGNITYYDRAVDMSNSIESNLYDVNIHAYNYSLTNSTKLFNTNIKLSKAYLDAFDIYSSTALDCNYNTSVVVPDFIFNQDVMNLTTIYSYKKNRQYYNPSNQSYVPFTVKYDIPNGTINYIFKDQNKNFVDQFNYSINNITSSHTLIYPILETLPLADGYYLYVWANTSYFKLTDSFKRFNVKSGVINMSIEGLVSSLIQGSVINVSLFINYTRNDNLTLTASLEGAQLLEYPSQQIYFTSFEEIQIDFNLTAKNGATPGDSNIYFRIKSGSIIYLEIKKVIEIGYPFEYSNLMYQGKVVSGDSISVSMNLKNFLPDVTQTINVSFSGTEEGYIENFIQEEILAENEIKTVSYFLESLNNITDDTISIKMSILIQNTEFYSESFEIEILPKFELISVGFPEKIPQGKPAYFILIIENNQEDSEEFSLYLNGKPISTNLDELNTGENRIVAKLTPSINPYEFGTKSFRFMLKDGSDNEIGRFYFKTNLELSALNLILFYVLPIIVPVGLILFFKNRDIKHKKLKR